MTNHSEIDDDLQTRFLQAVEKGDAATLRTLLAKGIDPDADLGVSRCALFMAAIDGNADIVAALIDRGANVNLSDQNGDTALSFALGVARDRSDEDEASVEDDDDDAFWHRAFEGEHVQVARLLLRSGARADTSNDFIKEFFMVCCRQGCMELLRALLDNGADVDAQSSVTYMTPLMNAVSHPEVFRFLLERGADISMQSCFDTTVLDLLLGEKRVDLAQLVVDRGGDVNEQKFYLTRAARDGDIDVVRFLLQNGADPNRPNDQDQTPSESARLGGHREILLLLREARGLPVIETFRRPPMPTQIARKRTFFQGLSGSSGKKNFRRGDDEVFLRSWWLAQKITNATAAVFAPTAISSWITDDRFREQDQKALFEILGYTSSFVLARLRSEMEESHRPSDETNDVHLGYQMSLGMAFNHVFGFKKDGGAEGVFVDLVSDYESPDYDDGYDDFWGICYDSDEVFASKTVDELLNEPLSEDEYNVERYYVYRLSKFVKVVDPVRIILNVLSYRDIGLRFYDDAFFRLSNTRVKKELKSIVNQ